MYRIDFHMDLLLQNLSALFLQMIGGYERNSLHSPSHFRGIGLLLQKSLATTEEYERPG